MDIRERLRLVGIEDEEHGRRLRPTPRWHLDLGQANEGPRPLARGPHPIRVDEDEVANRLLDCLSLHHQLTVPVGRAMKWSPSLMGTRSSRPMLPPKGFPCSSRVRSSVSGAPARSRMARPVTGEESNWTCLFLPSTSTTMLMMWCLVSTAVPCACVSIRSLWAPGSML